MPNIKIYAYNSVCITTGILVSIKIHKKVNLVTRRKVYGTKDRKVHVDIIKL